ncbi:MAG TPA: hypothetical protein VL549_01645 [Gemmatimonadales bacterium]|jgi:hypothetical protein|nr:hypothetical protein [Gemmatimonadales bacterium]
MIQRFLPTLCLALLSAPPLAAQEPRSSSKLITESEIDRARPNVANAFDVVQLLRPRWLRSRDIARLPGVRNDMAMERIHVYIDDRDMGDVEYLKSIPAEQIYTLKFVSMTEAGSRFGPTDGPGILVTLKR